MGVTQYTTGLSEKDSCRREEPGEEPEVFFKMLLEELEFVYAYVGCCMVEKPRWFILVLRMVGLIGDGDTGAGEMGDRMGVRVRGDFSDRVGRAD